MGGRAPAVVAASVPAAAPVDGGGGGGAPPIAVLRLPIGDGVVPPPLTGALWLLPLSPPEALLRGAMIAWIDMGWFISPVLVMARSNAMPNSDSFCSFVRGCAAVTWPMILVSLATSTSPLLVFMS